MTATKTFEEEKIAQRIQLAIRTSYIIGNQYLPVCDTNEIKEMRGNESVSVNNNFIDEKGTPKKTQL